MKFKEKVYRIVAEIPEGEVLTYKQVATRAGSPQAYRTVGSILAKNYNPGIPCHRVVRANGKVGGYNRGGEEEKERILKKERVDLAGRHAKN